MEEKVIMSLERYKDIIDTSKEYEEDSNELNDLLDYIFENTELSFDDELRFYSTNKLMDYLKNIEPYRYEMKVKKLKKKKEEVNK